MKFAPVTPPSGRARPEIVKPQPESSVFGTQLRRLREAAGLTQEDLAERAGIHRTYLSDIERGGRNVSLINIERLAQALDQRLSELFQLVE